MTPSERSTKSVVATPAFPVRIELPDAVLDSELEIPADAVGLIAFAHGSGSSRFSPRNRAVAQVLRQAKLGTLLLDLLTREETQSADLDADLRFDIPRLSQRLIGVCDWAAVLEATMSLPLGLFGASTGAAAAVVAAAKRPDSVKAVVSRGGRPDLAGDALRDVRAPTLLIVGSLDTPVITLNREASEQIPAPTRVEIIEGAGHLFEEPGMLDAVARLAADWFVRHLRKV